MILELDMNIFPYSVWAVMPVLMLSGAVVWAEEVAAPSEKAPTFASLDVNHDGQISRKEAAASNWLLEHFSKLDQNGDGILVWSEMPAPAAASLVRAGGS
jgi:hypothetical protein